MGSTPTSSVLEHWWCAPPCTAAAELSLPLTFCDIMWLVFNPIQRVHFYEFPHPKTHFTETIIPQLKQSLSLTLKHFFPVAGNLICPISDDFGHPELRYQTGDSVRLTFAESSDDFNYLAGNHPRNAEKFYPLVPQLSPPSVISGNEVKPLLALQVTVFPNSGISIGYTSLHVLGDANSVVNFIKSWALINKFKGDEQLMASTATSLPLFDKTVVPDPHELGKRILNALKMLKSQGAIEAPVVKIPVDKVRATFVLTQSEVQKLKNFVIAKQPNLPHLSTFTVTCAYAWTCWLKSMQSFEDQNVDDNETRYLFAWVDCRARLDPPIAPNYFGNCIVPCIITSTQGELVGSEGLIIAAAAIGEAIHKRINDKDGILKGCWLQETQAVIGKQGVLGISGSPKYDVYDADFGWGKPQKYEMVSTDGTGAMTLNKSRKFEGGLEIGFSLTESTMDALAAFFTNGLSNL